MWSSQGSWSMQRFAGKRLVRYVELSRQVVGWIVEIRQVVDRHSYWNYRVECKFVVGFSSFWISHAGHPAVSTAVPVHQQSTQHTPLHFYFYFLILIKSFTLTFSACFLYSNSFVSFGIKDLHKLLKTDNCKHPYAVCVKWFVSTH